MDAIFPFLSLTGLVVASLAAVAAGVVKGAVGFGMPMLLISVLSAFLPPDIALAGLILPTVVTNGAQAFGHGARAALASVRRFRVFLLTGLVFLAISAQMVNWIPAATLLVLISLPVTGFAAMQLAGVTFTLARQSAPIEVAAGALAGFVGGLSGVWGPPTVAYLTALNTQKAEQLRVQGVIYGLGAISLAVAHLGSGVLRAETLPFSALLIVPALAGQWVGRAIHDRIDQETFRRATLVVLLLAGLNLLRRGLLG